MTDRLEEIGVALDAALDKWVMTENDHRSRAEVMADALRAAGVTVPEPPNGPATSAEAAHTYWTALESSGVVPNRSLVCETRRALDAAMPLLIRDHALLPVAEVDAEIRRRVDALSESALVDIWLKGEHGGRSHLVASENVRLAILAALTRREG